MASKLGLFNGALRELGHDKLASLSEEAERRYVLDDVYDDVVDECLEAGQWKFAIRAVEIEDDTGIEPAFGYTYAFEKPVADFIRLTALSDNDRLSPSLSDYREEGGYWYADVTPLYAAYVSKDASYGLNLTEWPPGFAAFVELALAEAICMRLTQSDSKKQAVAKNLEKARKHARSIDAQAGPTRNPNGAGSWINNRFSSSTNTSRYDRGGGYR